MAELSVGALKVCAHTHTGTHVVLSILQPKLPPCERCVLDVVVVVVFGMLCS